MAKIECFEDLEAWDAGMQLASDVYDAFRQCDDAELKDQIKQMAVGIPTHIAEACERNTNKDFIRFLNLAKTACGELVTLLHLAVRQNHIEEQKGNELVKKAKYIATQIEDVKTL